MTLDTFLLSSIKITGYLAICAASFACSAWLLGKGLDWWRAMSKYGRHFYAYALNREWGKGDLYERARRDASEAREKALGEAANTVNIIAQEGGESSTIISETAFAAEAVIRGLMSDSNATKTGWMDRDQVRARTREINAEYWRLVNNQRYEESKP